MEKKNFSTLVELINYLSKNGYRDDFIAREDHIIAIYSKKKYGPEELLIVDTYRFEGMTNPSDEVLVLVIEANDGNKGTIVIPYNSDHDQDEGMIKKISYQ